MKYSTILFDADGMTIIPKRFSEQIQKDYGISWEKMKPFFDGAFQACKLGKADMKEELSRVLSDWGWTGTVDALMTYWFSIGSEPNPEIVAFVKELRAQGVKCYLATNQEKYRAEYLRDVVGLGNIFDDLFVSADFGHLKEEIAYFEEAYRRISSDLTESCPKSSMLFVDHEEKNLNAAREVGFSTYHYEDFPSFKAYVLGA